MKGSWRLNRTATYWPPLFWLSQPFFLVLLGCSAGGLGVQPMLGHGSHSSIFPPTDLNFLSPGLYNNLTSCERHNFALNSTPRQSRSPLISWYLRPDAPVIYTGAFLLLTAWPGRRSICNTKLFIYLLCTIQYNLIRTVNLFVWNLWLLSSATDSQFDDFNQVRRCRVTKSTEKKKKHVGGGMMVWFSLERNEKFKKKTNKKFNQETGSGKCPQMKDKSATLRNHWSWNRLHLKKKFMTIVNFL